MSRLDDLQGFYAILDLLEERLDGKRVLESCDGKMDWPERGVYFFFEPGEERSGSGEGMRVTRIGTHALAGKSRTTLWNRLSQHRGVVATGAGNHRGSIFRLLVGQALKGRDNTADPVSWGIGGDPGAAARKLDMTREAVKSAELGLECRVSRYIGRMPFLWLEIDDPPGAGSLRGLIERNSIALLSNCEEGNIDVPSGGWLGRYSDRERVRQSGLWNNRHVDEPYDPPFLKQFGQLVRKARF
jgi:hypothetical protein